MVDKWSTRRKGDYELRLTRTVNTPGRHSVELYLFIPPETTLSARTLSEQQFFFGSVAHSFGLMGLQGGDRAVKNDESFALLSPYFEIANSSWLLRYKASMGRLRGQLNNTDTPGETIARALRLSQAFAQRMRETQPSRDRQKRYLRQMVKAAATMFIMSILTYMLFNVRNASKTLSITLLLVSEQPGQGHSAAQLWRLRLGNSGIVQSKSKDPNWPSPEEQMKRSWWDRITAVFKKN
ncbi:hypothetical protein [Marinobacter vinifirmus]|uniref:Uncharacterized protein n=1 Tax=Marinobacter vinifirmus TaxID=355591 RepID=A0A558BEE4_9GAMM|nr:hypothetical protein [Marinobacter vinifirmus]TVT34887.1 MAG: hypothetical protein FHK81_04265 [Marinobacter vinifirmus]